MNGENFETAAPTGNGRRRRRERGPGQGEMITPPDRLPPHSPEAEQGVIACVLLDNNEPLNEAEERNVREHWFYDLRHQMLWRGIIELRKAGQAVDTITLMQWLRDRNMLEQIGGIGYLSQLPDLVPSAANAVHYLTILREQMLLREIVRAGTDAVASAYQVESGQKTNPDELVARLSRNIGRLTEETSQVAEVRIAQIIGSLMPELEQYHRGRAQIRGLITNLAYLDKLLCGMGGRNGNYVVWSGRPGTGKTSLAMQVAAFAATDYVWFDPVLQPRAGGGPPVPVEDETGVPKMTRKVSVPVGIFSYEMAAEALVERMLFNYAGADMQRWRTGFAENEDIMKITAAAHKLGAAPIYIDDNPGPVEALAARARRMFHTLGIRCFVIDYLQLMSSSRKRDDRVQELSDVSGQIRALSKSLNVPFIVLAQMNRDYEKDPTRAPRLSDLKDCGSIEQDADVVGFLYSPKLKEREKDQYDAAMETAYPGGDWSKRPSRVNMLVAKNRYGPTGKAELLFQKSATRFMDWFEWLKENGNKELAAGESRKAQQSGAQPPSGDGEEEEPEFLR